ncbi:Uncharacterised protein [Mycobacteroides abscessus subsp. abscessus]|nr:Uncharacterised protein [Mycobacteroides abscessus subsp. abscessus]
MGSIAASYWIGPSTSSSGARSRTRSVATRTFSTSAPLPDSPVEYDSIATRGSMPKRWAVRAEEMAMSASCSEVGSGTTAQHMRNTLETVCTPGTVLMISKEGRMVWAVVCAAPETMPSAMPSYTIMVPK